MKKGCAAILICVVGLMSLAQSVLAQSSTRKPGVIWRNDNQSWTPFGFFINSTSGKALSYRIFSGLHPSIGRDWDTVVRGSIDPSVLDGYPRAISPDGRYLVTETSNRRIVIHDVALRRRMEMPSNEKVEYFTPSVVNVVNGRVTVVGTATVSSHFGSGLSTKVFFWRVGEDVAFIESYRSLQGVYDGDLPGSSLKEVTSLAADGTLALCVHGLTEDGKKRAPLSLVGNIGSLSQPLRDTGACYQVSSPTGTFVARGGSRSGYDDANLSFGVGGWGPLHGGSGSDNFRNYQLRNAQGIAIARKYLRKIEGYSYTSAVRAITESGFIVVSALGTPTGGGWAETQAEVVVIAPGEGEFTLQKYLEKKGISVRVDAELAAFRPLQVIEKDGLRFIFVNDMLINLGAAPGSERQPGISATPIAPMM